MPKALAECPHLGKVPRQDRLTLKGFCWYLLKRECEGICPEQDCRQLHPRDILDTDEDRQQDAYVRLYEMGSTQN